MISLVIPVFNEKDSLPTLHEEIQAVVAEHKYECEIVFIDDGSTDGSWDTIAELAGKHSWVHGIRFRRNFGKAAALSAGFKAARGDHIVTMDADLQDDPKEIPRFLAKIQEGFEVVSGWKRVRHDPWHKVGPSRIFNAMVSKLTGVSLHDHNCGMKCYKSDAVREVRLYGELHRFIPVLAAARGFKVSEIEINHRARKFGYSKYGVRRFVKGFLDLLTVKFLTGYGRRPQHLLGTIGLLSFGLGNLGLLFLGITWIINCFFPFDERPFPPLHERPLMLYSAAALLVGAQMMSMGFLAELITAYQSRDEDSYSVKERTPEKPTHAP